MLNARIADHYILTSVRWLNRQDRILCHYQLVPAGRASSEKSYLLLHASLDPRKLVDNAVICKSTPGQLVNNGQQSTWGEEKSGLRWATKEAGTGNKGCKGGCPHAQTLTRDRQRKCNKEWWWLGTFHPWTFTNCNHLPNNKPSIRLQLHANCKGSSFHQQVVITHEGSSSRL